ncbi:hypothetical protein WR25_11069 [Diploscapter pachys]|uniref:Proteasome component Ecm29 N-terminal domain-containing protein n=1 Tax=Diploscapter pachys TaxID=2018661 RepID=A0A2A2L128_9BILA|nr:hypothetical protein WR25_11069 [Diploscapter pachys]
MIMNEEAETASDIASKDDFDRVYLRLAMCSSDDQLQKFTNANLVSIITFVMNNTQYTNDVGELLSHYNRRVRSNENIRFPVHKLIKIVASRNAIASNLAMVYLKYSKERMGQEEQVKLLPVYLETVAAVADDEDQANRMLLLCLPAFIALSKSDKRLWPSFSLSAPCTSRLLRFFSCILAFPSGQPDDLKAIVSAVSNGDVSYLYGLSPAEFLLIAQNYLSGSFQLTESKVAIIRVLSEEFVEELRAFPLFVLGSGAQINVVDDAAEAALKKVDM